MGISNLLRIFFSLLGGGGREGGGGKGGTVKYFHSLHPRELALTEVARRSSASDFSHVFSRARTF